MKYKVSILNAFTETSGGGNPAGVVLDADCLGEEKMLDIAQRVGHSETAFIQQSKLADYKFQYFTPAGEVDLCGHATVASFTLLSNLHKINRGNYSVETKAGIFAIKIGLDGVVLMEQQKPTFSQILGKELIARSLNISPEKFISNLPIQIVSTGLRDILVPIEKLSDLLEVEPDFDKITQISKENKAIGYHLFSLETMHSSTAHCRNFAPLYSIPEESATGTSNGALSCYLFKHGVINVKQSKQLIYEQGYSMKKPSKILAQLSVDGDKITQVFVGGKAISKSSIMVDIK